MLSSRIRYGQGLPLVFGSGGAPRVGVNQILNIVHTNISSLENSVAGVELNQKTVSIQFRKHNCGWSENVGRFSNEEDDDIEYRHCCCDDSCTYEYTDETGE